MALQIANINRSGGAACTHLRMAVRIESASPNMTVDFNEGDLDIDNDGPSFTIITKPGALSEERARHIFLMCALWARYRRRQGRPFLDVDIA